MAKSVEREVELLWEVIEEEGNRLVEMVETNLEGKVEFQLEEGMCGGLPRTGLGLIRISKRGAWV